MTATRPPEIWSDPHGHVRPVRVFHPDQCSGMPAAAAAFLRHAIAPGARLGRCVRISMHGKIKVGGWMSFRANELIDAPNGFWWDASVAHGLLTASDKYANGVGTTRVEAFGLIPIKRARDADTTRSTIGRFIAEQAVFMPGHLLADLGTNWHGLDAEHATASTSRDGERMQLSLHVTAEGRLLDMTTARWGRDGRNGYRYLPFGMQVDEERTFGDFTVPYAGRVGWWYGTPRWHSGEFFRFMIDEFQVF